jgi:hypothetical protein
VLAVLASTLALTLAGCGSDRPHAAPAPVTPAPVTPAPVTPAPVTKVLTIVLENHGPSATRTQMPRLVRLAGTYGQTSAYRALTHPSLPNYLAMAGGNLPGFRDDRPPEAHPMNGPTVFDTALAQGHPAATYAEGMPGNCAQADAGRYLVRHNPWTYFADPSSRAACATHDVPAGTLSQGQLHDDITAGTLPDVGMLLPDACNDAHDCSLAVADGWVASWVEELQAGPDWQAGRLAIVVTFDEAERVSSNAVLTVVAAPGLTGKVVSTPLTHLSWSRWMSEIAGAAPQGEAAHVPSLGGAFGL